MYQGHAVSNVGLYVGYDVGGIASINSKDNGDDAADDDDADDDYD